jgi:hypothetical protein
VAALKGLDSILAAGVSTEEYSVRLADVLLKFSDSTPSSTKFSDKHEKNLATEIDWYLGRAVAAYVYAKEYINPPSRPSSYWRTDLPEEEYAQAKVRFPQLAELPPVLTSEGVVTGSHKRWQLAQALWRVADQESQTAQNLLKELSGP